MFFHNKNFAYQLIISLSIGLAVAFFVVVVLIFHTSSKFIHKNAYYQVNTITTNALSFFHDKISEIENMPTIIEGLTENYTSREIAVLPAKIMTCYPIINGCSFIFPSNNQNTRQLHIGASRFTQDSIASFKFIACKSLLVDSSHIVKYDSIQGYWTFNNMTVSYYKPICSKANHNAGILKLDFDTKTITDFICNIKQLGLGYLFVCDKNGNIIARPQEVKRPAFNLNYKNLFLHPSIDSIDILVPLLNGKIGYGYITDNQTAYYIHYRPIPQSTWRLGIIYPYNEILVHSRLFTSLTTICLFVVFLLLLCFIAYVIYKFSSPIKLLSHQIRLLAKNNMECTLPPLPPALEIMEVQELYNSFCYMQEKLSSYIAQLKTTMMDNERIATEMKLAQKIQQRFMPKKISLPENIELYANLLQSREVGGDLYDYFLTDNNLYFTVGDVSGKSMPAALYMASIVKLFRYIASQTSSTAHICSTINKYMCDTIDDDMYMTMFAGIMDIKTGTITFTNAGHTYPLVINKEKDIIFLDKYPDVPIGILGDHHYTEHQYTLDQETSILLYTDGITDTENAHATFYGMDKLLNCIKASPLSSESMINNVMTDIREHNEGEAQFDDQTILAILFKGIPQ